MLCIDSLHPLAMSIFDHIHIFYPQEPYSFLYGIFYKTHCVPNKNITDSSVLYFSN